MTTIINKGKIGLEDLFLADSPEYPSAEFSRTGQISTSTLHKIPNIFYSGAESFFDTDGTLADNSDNKSCTQKAIKTYVDASTGSQVSDAAYNASWDNVTDIAPSKNAVYDEFVTILASISAKEPGGVYALSDGATIAVDWSNGATQYVTLGATGRTVTFANPVEGAVYRLVIFPNETGTITTWPTIKWSGGSAPTLTTTAAKADIVTLLHVNSSYYADCAYNF